MQRFFVTFPLQIDMSIADTDLLHQLTRVLRVSIWEDIILFSGDGLETVYEIVSIEKSRIWLRGKSQNRPQTEPKKQITLYQALPNKYEKIEYILQKWVEVGIYRFIFFRSDRSQKLILSPNKIERFRAIAREALEQCGGVLMPEIVFEDGGMDGVLESNLSQEPKTNIILDTTGKSIWIWEQGYLHSMWLWVGPEGGWSENERTKMIDNGYIFARFWERILRTETAWVVIAFGFLNATEGY